MSDDDQAKDTVDDEELLARLGAALRDESDESGDGGDGWVAPGSEPSSGLRARVFAAAERAAYATPARVVPLRPAARRPRFVAAVTTALAVAAAGALWVRASPPPADIPAYEAELTTADATTRGASDVAGEPAGEARASLRLSGERFVLVVRPQSAPSVAVSARAFLFQGDRAIPWQPPLIVGPEGVVRIAGARAEILPAVEGEVEVIVAVGEASRLPREASEARAAVAAGAARSGYRAVAIHFAVVR